MRCPAAPGHPGAAARRSGRVRRGRDAAFVNLQPDPRARLPAWGSRAWGWDAATSPGCPDTVCVGAERARGAPSRPSGPLGCLGPASRSPTPRSRRPSRPHPGRREPRTLECQEGRGKTQLAPHPTPPLSSHYPRPHRPRPGGPGSAPVRGADPAPAAGGSAAPGRARRAPVSAGLRLQPRSARGPLRHRPPGRAGGRVTVASQRGNRSALGCKGKQPGKGGAGKRRRGRVYSYIPGLLPESPGGCSLTPQQFTTVAGPH